MTFEEWWDSLPNSLPHQTKEKMRLAWNDGRIALANELMERFPTLKGGDVDREIQCALERAA